jgi:hypothetical protein
MSTTINKQAAHPHLLADIQCQLASSVKRLLLLLLSVHRQKCGHIILISRCSSLTCLLMSSASLRASSVRWLLLLLCVHKQSAYKITNRPLCTPHLLADVQCQLCEVAAAAAAAGSAQDITTCIKPRSLQQPHLLADVQCQLTSSVDWLLLLLLSTHKQKRG